MKKQTLIVFAIVLLLIIIDQVSKYLIYEHFKVQHLGSQSYVVSNPDAEIKIIGDMVKFVYVENAGMAFGIQFGEFKIILSLFSIFASILLIWLIIKIQDSPIVIQIAFGFILAGAVGNLIDRVFYGVIFGYAPLFYGRVIDFIQVDIPDIHIGNLINYTHWPVFNVADSCVTIGVALLIIFNRKLPNFSALLKRKEPNTIN
ncbi:signal peptidase II [Bacteroidetes/Chlorobi group bacterium MS-B_bin-24]|jgi:signal peptidase II|nr:MAG: signal peptidase II [Bacteroidetes/Chlorobi group bacterium MS-B_bin-24]